MARRGKLSGIRLLSSSGLPHPTEGLKGRNRFGAVKCGFSFFQESRITVRGLSPKAAMRPVQKWNFQRDQCKSGNPSESKQIAGRYQISRADAPVAKNRIRSVIIAIRQSLGYGQTCMNRVISSRGHRPRAVLARQKPRPPSQKG